MASIGPRDKRTNRYKKWQDLNKKMVQVLNDIISKKGGEVIQNIADFDAKQHCQSLIVILSEFMTKSQFDELFGAKMQNDENFVFVTLEFITSSSKCQRRASLEQFKPKCLTQHFVTHSQIKNVSETNKNEHNNKKITKQIRKKKGDWLDSNKHKFACQIENDGQRMNYNQNITDIFDELEDIYHCLGDKWREFGYKKANGIIKKHEKKLKNMDDIKELIKKKGFGKKVGDKCLEIIKTGKLRKLDELKKMPQIKTIKLFSKIFDVGPVTAQTWYNLG